MKGLEYITSRQQRWAQQNGYILIDGSRSGSGSSRGKSCYFQNVEDNLFEGLSEQSLENFRQGNGGEIQDRRFALAKMKAIYSSSAMAVNMFQYWQNKNVLPILNACGVRLKKSQVYERLLVFEKKLSIQHSPNIDVFIGGSKEACAIECKFAEPYRKQHRGLRETYLKNGKLFDDVCLPNLYELAQAISPNDHKFIYLNASQLIKHILGLKRTYRDSGFSMLYLWYAVPGRDGTEHRKEIDAFAEIAIRDNVSFRHITYQEVIWNLLRSCREGNEKYLEYLMDRYF